jgi:hypothetical protein
MEGSMAHHNDKPKQDEAAAAEPQAKAEVTDPEPPKGDTEDEDTAGQGPLVYQ